MKRIGFYRKAAVVLLAAVLGGLASWSAADDSSKVSPEEMAFMNDWVGGMLSNTPAPEDCRFGQDLPFFFKCGGRSSRDVVRRETAVVTRGEWENGQRKNLMTWKDPDTLILCEVEMTEYADFPAVEWLIRLTNESDKDSEKISLFRAIDTAWNTPGVLPYLYRSHGGEARMEDFRLEREELRKSLWDKGRQIRMDSETNEARRKIIGDSWRDSDGRPSAMWLPFFNLQTKDDGVIFGLGWNGAWYANFNHDGEGNVWIDAGMDHLNTKLHPGESIRSPLVLTMYYKGSFLHAQNMFRQFALRYHTPQENGKPVRMPNCLSSWGGMGVQGHLDRLDTMIGKYKLPYDCYWIDAGWYGRTIPPEESDAGDWARTVGDWNPNADRYPNGMAPIGEKAAQYGLKFLLWFEAERACWGVPMTKEHPEWYLKSKEGEPAEWSAVLLDLGNPEARSWITELLSKMFTESKISVYREDFNMVPDPNWAFNDEPDREGMKEMRFVEGLYQLWDDLLTRHPGLLIDNCASGGRRIELEAMKRSVVLWRTDYNCFGDIKTESTQAHGFGLSYWLPTNAISPGTPAADTYQFRSALSAGSNLTANPETDGEWLRERILEAKRAQPFFYGDFYPLEGDGNDDLSTWLVECFQIPEDNSGMILAFRRPEASARAMTFDIPQLDVEKVYHFEDVDSKEEWDVTGKELQEKGLTVTIPNPRESRLIFWK